MRAPDFWLLLEAIAAMQIPAMMRVVNTPQPIAKEPNMPTEEGESHSTDEGDIEVAVEGLFRVDATIDCLGQEHPRQCVDDDDDGREERRQDGQDAHERQVPARAGRDSRAHATDDARLRPIPARVSQGIEEPVAARGLLARAVRVRRAARPTHGVLPLDGIHSLRIDTTTQPKLPSWAIVGDPLNAP